MKTYYVELKRFEIVEQCGHLHIEAENMEELKDKIKEDIANGLLDVHDVKYHLYSELPDMDKEVLENDTFAITNTKDITPEPTVQEQVEIPNGQIELLRKAVEWYLKLNQISNGDKDTEFDLISLNGILQAIIDEGKLTVTIPCEVKDKFVFKYGVDFPEYIYNKQ